MKSIFKSALAGMLISGCAVVGPDEAAVVHSFGSLDQNVYTSGIHGALFSNFEIFTIRQQAHTETLDNFTEDLQNVKSKLVIKYTTNASNLVNTYKAIAPNDATLYTNYVLPVVMSRFKALVSKYTLEEMVSSREKFSDETQKHIEEQFAKEKVIHLDSISIVDLTLDAKFTQAIEDKQIALQRLAQSKTEVEISEQEAKKQKMLEATLSDKILTKMFIEAWRETKQPLYFCPRGVELMMEVPNGK